MASEEDRGRDLEARLTEAHAREQQLLAKLALVKADHAAAVGEIHQQSWLLAQLQAALEASSEPGSNYHAAEEAAAAAAAMQQQQRAADALRSEVGGVREALAAALARQQGLLDELAARDKRVAELASAAGAARAEAAARSLDCGRMEGVLRATGERAAAAEEEAANARSEMEAFRREVLVLQGR